MGLVLGKKEKARDGVSRMMNVQIPTEVMGADETTQQVTKVSKDKLRDPDVGRNKKLIYDQRISTFTRYSLLIYN